MKRIGIKIVVLSVFLVGCQRSERISPEQAATGPQPQNAPIPAAIPNLEPPPFEPLRDSEDYFTKVENQAQQYLSHSCEEPYSHQLTVLYGEVASVYGDLRPDEMELIFDHWSQIHPNSHVAWLIRAKFEINYAWVARGGGPGNEVDKENAQIFIRRLERAKEDLGRAEKLTPQDPNIPAQSIKIAMALDHADDAKQAFDKAVAICPGHVAAHRAMMTAILPQWGGSIRELNRFDDQVREDSARYPYLAVVWADAQWEQDNLLNSNWGSYLGSEKIWPQVVGIYGALMTRYPSDSLLLRSDFAYYAWWTKHYSAAEEQFKIIGDRWIPGSRFGNLRTYRNIRGKTETALANATRGGQ